MQRRNRLNASYYCRYYYETKQEGCCPENVKEAELIEIVLSAIRNQAMRVGETQKLRNLYNRQVQGRVKANQERENQLQEQLQQLTDSNFSLYESYAKGEIDADRFLQKKGNNNKQIEIYKAELQACHSKEIAVPDEKPDLLNVLEGKEDFTDLTKELVRQLVDAVYVYGNNRVEVVFKFQDKGVETLKN